MAENPRLMVICLDLHVYSWPQPKFICSDLHSIPRPGEMFIYSSVIAILCPWPMFISPDLQATPGPDQCSSLVICMPFCSPTSSSLAYRRSPLNLSLCEKKKSNKRKTSWTFSTLKQRNVHGQTMPLITDEKYTSVPSGRPVREKRSDDVGA